MKLKFLIAVLFVALSVSGQESFLEVSGLIENSSGQIIVGASVDIYTGSVKKQSAKTNQKGIFTIKLEYGKEYKVIVSQKNMIQKRIDFNTHVPESDRRNLIKEFAMTIVPSCDGADVAVFEKPVDIVKYDEGFRNFVSDQSHVQQMQAKIKSAYLSIERCKENKYQDKKAEADKAFKENNFELAEQLYREALEIIPTDSYSKRQISQSKKNQEKQNLNLARADKLVTEGEQYLSQNKIDAALQRFNEARKLNPNDTRAAEKIKEIEQIKTRIAQEQQQAQAVTEQYNTAIKKANDAMAAKNYALAKQHYEEAQTLKPNEAFPAQKLVQAQQAVEQVAKEKQEAERVAKAFDAAITAGQQALQKGDFETARQHYKKAMSLNPKSPIAQQQIAEIERRETEKRQQELKAQREELERQYTELVQKADGLLAQKEYDNAVLAYKEAMGLKPADPYSQSQIQKAKNLKVEEEQQKQVAIEQQYEKAISMGDASKAAKEFEKAIEAYKQAIQIKPNAPDAKSKLAQAEKLLADKVQRDIEEQELKVKYKQLLQEGDSYFKNGNYEQSKAKFQEALTMYPLEAYPKNQIASIDNLMAKNATEKTYNEIIASADNYFNQQQFAEAIAEYKKAQGVIATNTYPQERINEIKKIQSQQAKDKIQAEYDQFVAQAEELVKQENYTQAKAIYGKAAKVLPENPYPQQRINEINELISKKAQSEIEKQYNDLVAQAETQLTQGQYDQAKTLYVQASKVLPENTYPQQRINEINKMISDKAKSEIEEKYNNLASQAEQQVNQEQYQKAKTLYAQAATLMPENPYPQQRINEINELISQKSKSAIEEEYNKLVDQAEAQVTSEQYDQAKLLYTRAQKILPENPYPQQRINEINKIISDRSKSRTEAEYNKLVAQAEEQVNNEQYDNAKTLYTQASKIIPENPYPQQRINEINKIISDRSKSRTEAEYNKLVAQAEEQVNNEQYDNAKALYTQASKIIPENPYPQQRINEINQLIDERAKGNLAKEYQAVIQEADRQFQQKKFQEAKLSYAQAQKIDNEQNYPQQRINEINQILSQLSRQEVEGQYNKEIADADAHFSGKRYSEAIQAYGRASKIIPEKDYPQLQINKIKSMLAEVSRIEREKLEIQANYDKTIALADKYFAEKNYVLARTEYIKASQIFSDKPYPGSQLSKIETLLAEKQKQEAERRSMEKNYSDAIASADALFKQRKLEEAKSYYSKALGIKPQSPHATSQIKRIDQLIADKAAALQEANDLEKKYKEYIVNADAKFGSHQYALARKLYMSALGLKPNEVYPRDQLKKVDQRLKLLATTKTAAGSPPSKIEKKSLADLSFQNKSEADRYLQKLAKEFPEGITVEEYKEGKKTTKRYVVVRNGQANEYREIVFSWGGSEYSANGKPTNAMYIRAQIKPKPGEQVFK